MERELLERIAHNTEPKELFQIVVSDNKTKFTTRFNPHSVEDGQEVRNSISKSRNILQFSKRRRH